MKVAHRRGGRLTALTCYIVGPSRSGLDDGSRSGVRPRPCPNPTRRLRWPSPRCPSWGTWARIRRSSASRARSVAPSRTANKWVSHLQASPPRRGGRCCTAHCQVNQVQIYARHAVRNPTASALSTIQASVAKVANRTSTNTSYGFLQNYYYGNGVVANECVAERLSYR